MNLKSIVKAVIAVAMTITMTASLCACGNQTSTTPSGTAVQDTTATQTESVSREHRKIIIDTDAQAYKTMLDSGLPITVIGLDMCDGKAMWTDDQFTELESLNDIGKFVAKSFGKIREFYKSNGSENVMNCDSVAMMCALYPEFVKNTVSTHASCITDEGETYSQVIFYKKGFTYDVVKNDFDYNVTLVTEADKAAYFKN